MLFVVRFFVGDLRFLGEDIFLQRVHLCVVKASYFHNKYICMQSKRHIFIISTFACSQSIIFSQQATCLLQKHDIFTVSVIIYYEKFYFSEKTIRFLSKHFIFSKVHLSITGHFISRCHTHRYPARCFPASAACR